MTPAGTTRAARPRFAVAAVAVTLGTVALVGAQSMSRLGSVFPIGAGLVLLLGGLASAALGWRERRAARGSAPPADGPDAADADASDERNAADERTRELERLAAVDAASAAELQRVSWPRWTAMVLALAAWALLLEPLGFLVTSVFGTAAIAAATWRERAAPAAVIGHVVVFAGLIGGFYAIMRFTLRIAVP